MGIQTIGVFSGFAVRELEQARAFYGGVLGLGVSDERGALRLALPADPQSGMGGASVFVYEKADHVPAVFTILNLMVGDIDAAARQLEAAGVALLRYDGFEQDEYGIARDPNGPAIAWFTDPSGNILSILQPD